MFHRCCRFPNFTLLAWNECLELQPLYLPIRISDIPVKAGLIFPCFLWYWIICTVVIILIFVIQHQRGFEYLKYRLIEERSISLKSAIGTTLLAEHILVHHIWAFNKVIFSIIHTIISDSIEKWYQCPWDAGIYVEMRLDGVPVV